MRKKTRKLLGTVALSMAAGFGVDLVEAGLRRFRDYRHPSAPAG